MGRRGWEGGEGARRGARARADTPFPPPSHSCNLGYAFVNCTGPAAAAACAAALHGARWSAFNSRKVCAVAWARVQGRAALVDHFRGARFPAAGAGCVPDPTRAAAYLPAYGMIILTLVLLLRPQGLFWRKA